MKKNNETFRRKITQLIEEVEKQSQAEVVVQLQTQVRSYVEIALAGGAILMIAAYSFLMFTPTIIDVYSIYYISIISFVAGFSLSFFVQPLKRMILSDKRLNREVDIYSRAVFQKAGIRHTLKETGVLVFISFFERKARILADRGVENNIPEEEWRKIKSGFDNLFKARNIEDEILSLLENCKNELSKFIPAEEENINELPDEIELKFE